ncbi:MAG: hypothetical protein HWE30_13720 [Methylocystaceae bacterium]|nr:hypothetical protein [Methylocystaceae bacterium]
MRQLIAGFLVIVGLAACVQTAPPVQILPEITFVHLPQLKLDVAAIDVVNESKASSEGRDVSLQFPTSPAKAINNWVRDRLVPAGDQGVARVTILEATALETKLDKATGVKGLFTTDQSERYSVTANVRIDVLDRNGNVRAFSSAQTNRYTTVAEDISLLDRERAWFNLVEKLMTDFNAAMDANVKNNLPLK